MSRREGLLTHLLIVIAAILCFSQEKQNPKQRKEPGQAAEPTERQDINKTEPSASASQEAGSQEPKGPWHGLVWRLIGPFRGGRVLAVSGVVGDTHTYYFGSTGGGVWKSTDD